MKTAALGYPIERESLSGEQRQQLESLVEQWREWNQRLNLFSRRDTDHLWERHVDPVLVFPRYFAFPDDATVLDLGTGGGVPGLVLAILYPRVRFCLLDSVGKKVAAVESIRGTLGLEGVTTRWGRVESLGQRFDFVVGRAVTALPKFLSWASPCLRSRVDSQPGTGVYYWKGGDPLEDQRELGEPATSVVRFGTGPEGGDEGKYLAFYSREQMQSIHARLGSREK